MDTPSTSPLEATVEATPNSLVASPGSRKLALHLTGSSQLTLHEQQLLRVRLRVAALVLFVGFLLYLVFSLVSPQIWLQMPQLLISQIITTTTLGLCAFSLCRKCKISQLRLRIEEAVVFGMPASFFALAEYVELTTCATAHEYLPNPCPPWILLVFTYALFIPNRLRRGAIIISVMTIAPVAILLVLMLTDSMCKLAHNADAMFAMKTTLLMTVTGIIATTGVARIGVLRKEAFAAKELGQYRLKKLIGRGGMGEVYLAEHQLMKRACAIKLIRQEKATDPRALARFEREVQAVAKLTHWNSVYVFDYGRAEDGTFYFVMEYLPGMSLQDLVDRYGPLPASRAIHFLRQTCAALQEAHEMGLIHRDLKPGNIFSARLGGVDDVAKLLDFGLVKSLEANDSAELTMVGMIAGSPQFMAPEIATSDHEPDVRSDIYSLGAVAYFLLTGRVPFPGEQPLKVLMAHASEPVQNPSELNPDIPSDLEQIVVQCLAKKPVDRPQSAFELAELLDRCDAAGQWTREDARIWWSSNAASSESTSDPEFAAAHTE